MTKETREAWEAANRELQELLKKLRDDARS